MHFTRQIESSHCQRVTFPERQRLGRRATERGEDVAPDMELLDSFISERERYSEKRFQLLLGRIHFMRMQ